MSGEALAKPEAQVAAQNAASAVVWPRGSGLCPWEKGPSLVARGSSGAKPYLTFDAGQRPLRAQRSLAERERGLTLVSAWSAVMGSGLIRA